MIDLNDLDAVPTAPFVFSRNGVEHFGGFLEVTDTGFVFFDGSRTLEVDDTFESNADGRFVSRVYEQVLVFREITAADKKLLADKTVRDLVNTADEVKALASLELASGLYY